MITAFLLLASAQSPDTTSMNHVFRVAVVAAYDLMKNSPFVRDAKHIKIDHQSMKTAARTDQDLSDVVGALGTIGTVDERGDCGNHERCPIIKGDSVVRRGNTLVVYLTLDATQRHEGKMYWSIGSYIVTLTRRNGKLEVTSAAPGSIS